jgi:5-methyltetrahydrofolate--homocysteine methyltransferase
LKRGNKWRYSCEKFYLIEILEAMMNFEDYRGEPDIDRLLEAFKHRKVDRVPNFEVLLEDKHVEQILGRYAGNTLAIGGDPAKGVEESEGARPMHPEDYLEICKIIGQDSMIVEAIWTPFKKKKSDGSLSIVADRSIKSRKDFNERIVPPSDDDIEEKMQFVKEYRQAIDNSGTNIGFCVLVAAYFQTLYEFMIGMEDCMTLVYKDREFIEELLEIGTQYWEKFVKRAIEEGVDFVWAADDVAFKTGLFLPPKIMKEMWLPHLQRIIAPAVSARKPVMFHSDGKIDDIVPWLADIGVDCIQPMDPYGIDYRDYKKKYGNLVCLAGNFDIEFPLAHGTPEDVERDVQEHMEVLKPGGGYVATSSHSIVNYIPHENFIAMINAIHRYGAYEGETWSSKGTEKIQLETPLGEAVHSVHGVHRRGVQQGIYQKIFDAVYSGHQDRIKELVQEAMDQNHTPVDVIDNSLTPAIKEVGDAFSTGELFLPDLLLAASTMQEAMQILTPLMADSEQRTGKGKIVIGTIKGDLHDIGKNLVIALLKGNGFEVVDLGIDNGPVDFVNAVREHSPDVVGYSGLLTTTLGGIPDQIRALQKEGLRDTVLTIVGGAPVTQDFASRNSIDLYGKDANEAVKVIEKALAHKIR